jgi:GTP-sensing pleiotropic transcriptional regulator CodY
MKIETTAYIKDEQLFVRNRSYIDREAVKSGVLEFDVIIQKKSKHRSVSQSRYYWGVVVGLIRERFIDLGNDVSKEETHDYLKQEFNYREFVNEKTSEVIRIPMSTANLTTTEFINFVARIQVFAATVLDIQIPEPSEQIQLHLE